MFWEFSGDRNGELLALVNNSLRGGAQTNESALKNNWKTAYATPFALENFPMKFLSEVVEAKDTKPTVSWS